MTDMSLALRNNFSILFSTGFTKKLATLLVFCFVGFGVAYAQEPKDKKKKSGEDNFLNYEEPDFLVDKDTTEVITKKKKKRKKKTFNGLKTKRGFTKSGSGKRTTLELFYYLKKHKEPDKYVTPVYLFEVQQLRIVKVKKYDKEKYPPKEFKILHGPYTKRRDTTLLMEGYFYIGTKHHRWETYTNDEVLKEKKVYHKGWPAESKITYYDAKKKKPREIIPVVWGVKDGTYLYYYESGGIKEKGKYINDLKVGKWYEYYPGKGRTKKITEHAKDGYDKDYTPKVLKEYDEQGKIIGGTEKGEDKKKKKLGSR